MYYVHVPLTGANTGFKPIDVSRIVYSDPLGISVLCGAVAWLVLVTVAIFVRREVK
jgi:hypothetical protein